MVKYFFIFFLIFPSILYGEPLPDNSHPNILGTGWTCNTGYFKSGQRCEKVIIPENGKLNVYGNDWTCNTGYKKLNNSCIPMTSEGLQRQRAQEQEILKKIQARRLRGVSGDDCETEYKTNAEVCVKVTSANLDCNKSFAGNYYNDCDATIRYNVETDYAGGSYLDVEVECRIEIEYKGKNTLITQSDFSRKNESHTLYAHGSDSERMRFNFSFLSFDEVTRVKIGSVKCTIESVDLW